MDINTKRMGYKQGNNVEEVILHPVNFNPLLVLVQKLVGTLTVILESR